MKSSFDKQKVYELLWTIPFGKVITYGGFATMLGNPMWARAVGNALHENPDGDKYPCYKDQSEKSRKELCAVLPKW